MTLTVSPWLVWAGASLALFGVVWVLRGTVRGLRDCVAWLADWLQSRIDPPWWWKPWLYRFRGDDQDAATEGEELPPLPPERSWEQMTSHQLPVDYRAACPRCVLTDDGFACQKDLGGLCPALSEWRERRPRPYEAEARAHYVAMGFEFPSGLMARVRELTP